MANDPTRKQILDALRSYQRADTLSIDLAEFVESMADENDRGLVVALGSVVEDMLADRIFKNFVRSDQAFKKDLLRQGSLLASAADKSKLALALGLIDERDADNIEVLSVMRNACAHSRQHIGFSTPVMRDALAVLHWRNPQSVEILRSTRDPKWLRSAYIAAVGSVVARIRGETDEISRVEASLRDIFSHSPTRGSLLKRLKQRSKMIGRRERTSKAPQRPPRSSQE